jgi:NDP-sugar pyrophosphorylase family protein
MAVEPIVESAESAESVPSFRQSALPALFADLPAVFAERFDPEAPWELLGKALTEILDALPSDAIEIRPLPDVHLAGDRIAIGRGTRIHPTAVIEGPVWIGRDVEIRPGAYIRGGAWIGDRCVVGANTEIKCAILLPGAHAPHLNYVGDSILGRGVNLGAGTILSNFRHDGREIQIPVESLPGALPGDSGRIKTGRRKLGAILGDGVYTGCNSVLHPGCIVGRGTQIYPGVQLRPGIYPEASLIKLRQEIEIAPIRVVENPRW